MIIIDIDMPTRCSSCPIYDGEYGECQLRTCFPSRFTDLHALFDDRPSNCPLKEGEVNENDRRRISRADEEPDS